MSFTNDICQVERSSRSFSTLIIQKRTVVIIPPQLKNYVLTDGDRFIYRNHQGKYVPASGESMAEHYTKAQAENVLKNCLAKPLRKIFRVQKIVVADPKEVKALTNAQLNENAEKVMETDYVAQWLVKLEELNGLADEASQRREILRKELSKVDQEKSDEEHYIELVNCNAYQGYLAFSRLQKIMRRRRTIKNELTVLNIICEKEIGKVASDEIKEQIAGLDKRKYHPRQKAELFDI